MIKEILKYAICGVMFIAGCGCSSDEIVSLPDEYICFDSSVTRAVVEQATDMGSFKVWGWHTISGQSAAAQDFDGVEVTFDNYAREWSYSPPRAWIWNSTHTFYALYPATIEANYTVDGKLNIDNIDLRQNNSYNNLLYTRGYYYGFIKTFANGRKTLHVQPSRATCRYDIAHAPK